MVVDNEFEPGKPHAVIGHPRNSECVVGVADVDHYLRLWAILVGDLLLLDLKLYLAIIDISAFTFGTRDGYINTALRIFSVPSPVPTMQGIPSSRLMIAL